MEKVIVRAEEFGVKADMAMELTTGLNVAKEERKLLIEEFENVSKLEVTEENIPLFKELRNRIVKNRTQGIEKWHKASKEVFLKGGQFVDAIRRNEVLINTQMEEKLLEGEKHFENLEKARLEKLQSDRATKLLPYDELAEDRDLTKLEDDEFEAILKMKRETHEAKIKAEKEAEELKAKQEKEAEEERIRLEEENKKIKAELESKRVEQLAEERKRRILEEEREAKETANRLEAERKQKVIDDAKEEELRKERELHEAELKAEREKAEKIRLAQQAKIDAIQAKADAEDKARKAEAKKLAETEAKLKAEKEAEIQMTLSRGDNEKLDSLIEDIEALQGKYKFSDLRNGMLSDTIDGLLVKVVTYINKNRK